MRTKIVPLIAFSLVAVLALAGTAAAQSGPNPDAPRWVEADYQVSLDEGLQQLVLDGTVDIRKVEADTRELRFVCDGSTCSADELREAYQQGNERQKRQLVASMEAAVEDRIGAALSSMATSDATPSSNATVNESALAEPAEGDEYAPPIPIAAEGSVELGLLDGTGVDADQVEALFRMGARVDQAIDQPVRAGTNLTLTLDVPSSVSVLSAENGTPLADGSQVTWAEANWRSGSQARIADQVRLGDPEVEVPTETDAEVSVTLDVSNVNVRYGNLFGGSQPADARVAVEVDGRFGAIENPRDLDRVHLPYLSADAVRIALDNGLLDTRELISLEEEARSQMKQTMQGITGESVEVRGGFPAGDLTEQAIGDPPGTGEAIELRLNASAQVPFPPEQTSGAAAQGFTVTTLSMGNIELPTFDTPYGVDSEITIVLPEGLELDFQTPAGYTVEEAEREGRQAYTFSSTDDGSSSETSSTQAATIQDANVVVNHPFVWNVFWPVLVALALLLVVLPAVVIGLTIRRRRKQGPPTAGETSQPVSGSQASQRSSGED